MLANVPNTQVHRYSCTFFSHVPCYVQEYIVEEHCTHTHMYLLTYLHTKKIKKEKKKTKKKKTKKNATHSCIVGTKIAYLYLQMSFPHVFHIFLKFSTFPHFSHKVFHIFWALFHTFSTFFWIFPHFLFCFLYPQVFYHN